MRRLASCWAEMPGTEASQKVARAMIHAAEELGGRSLNRTEVNTLRPWTIDPAGLDAPRNEPRVVRCLANHMNSNTQLQILPQFVCGINRGLECNSQSQTSPVPQRQTESPGLGN